MMKSESPSEPFSSEIDVDTSFEVNPCAPNMNLKTAGERECLPFPEMGFDFEDIDSILETEA